ncbi:MAG: hypothetical protein NZ869_09605, partial [Thermoanaerobaculum sp.]|nr:hypothetical protein [Thermoanaerobaculum sp.]MDW7967839.1 hypothetical protein [Thermoanaerobaculum sp.]
LLARRLLTCTVENPTHTFPQLWLLLPAGLFLAQVVDPYQVPRVSRERLVALVSSGLAAEALFLGPQFSRRSFNLFGIWVQPRGLRRWVVEQIRRLTAS